MKEYLQLGFSFALILIMAKLPAQTSPVMSAEARAVFGQGEILKQQTTTSLQQLVLNHPHMLSATQSGTLQTWLGAAGGLVTAIGGGAIGLVTDATTKSDLGFAEMALGAVVSFLEVGFGYAPAQTNQGYLTRSMRAICTWNKSSAKHTTNVAAMTNDLEKFKKTMGKLKAKYKDTSVTSKLTLI